MPNPTHNETRNALTDARNAHFCELVAKYLAETKGSGLNASTQLDIAVNRVAKQFFLSKSTIRKIITGSQSPRRKKIVEASKLVA